MPQAVLWELSSLFWLSSVPQLLEQIQPPFWPMYPEDKSLLDIQRDPRLPISGLYGSLRLVDFEELYPNTLCFLGDFEWIGGSGWNRTSVIGYVIKNTKEPQWACAHDLF